MLQPISEQMNCSFMKVPSSPLPPKLAHSSVDSMHYIAQLMAHLSTMIRFCRNFQLCPSKLDILSMQLLALALYILTRLVLFLVDNEPARESVPSNAKLRHRKLNKRTEKDLFHKGNCNYNFEKTIK